MYLYFLRSPLSSRRIEDSREAWENLDSFFNTQDEIRGYILENELVSLHPSNFETIEQLFTKINSLALQ